MTNAKFAQTDDWFKKVCADMCIKATSRQASKWRRKKGLAYKLATLTATEHDFRQ